MHAGLGGHTHLAVLCPGLPGSAGTRKVKPVYVLLKQETVSGSGISWAICKSAPRSRQITTPAPHHSVFTGRMPFLPPNQQRQSTERNFRLNAKSQWPAFLLLCFAQPVWSDDQSASSCFVHVTSTCCYVMMTSFGRYALIGKPSVQATPPAACKRLRLAVFVPHIAACLDYSVRVYFVEDTACALEVGSLYTRRIPTSSVSYYFLTAFRAFCITWLSGLSFIAVGLGLLKS